MSLKVGDKVCIPSRSSIGIISGVYQVGHSEEKLYNVRVAGIKLDFSLIVQGQYMVFYKDLTECESQLILYNDLTDLTELERIIYGV